MLKVFFCFFAFWLQIVLAVSEFPRNLPENASYIDFSYQPLQKTVLFTSESLLLNCELKRFSNKTVLNNITLPSNIIWLKNDHPLRLRKSSLKARLLQNGSLLISSVRRPDSGFYQCQASYQENVLLSQKAQVKVIEISRTPPLSRSISNCPASVTYLKCAHTSEENRINITWFKNNREIGSSAFYSQKDDFSTNRPNDYVVLPNGTLEIIRTDYSNEGRYECRVVTATDIIKSNQYVVHDADDCPLTRPRFVAEPFDTTATTGKSAFLPCGVSGFSEGTFMWFKNGKQVQFQSSTRFRRIGQASLLIKDVQLEDDAEYSCRFKSPTVTLTAFAKLTVVEAPHLLSPVNHLHLPYSGCEVELSCNVSGSPIPTISWYKNAQPVVQSRNIMVQNGGKLVLKQIDGDGDNGIYQCFAENQAGQIQIAYQLFAQGSINRNVTGWNGTVHLESLNSNSAVITWPAFRLFRPFTYEVLVIDDTEAKETSYESKKNRFKIDNLKANHTIRVRIFPKSNTCRGRASQAVTFVVPNKFDQQRIGLVQSFAVEPFTDRVEVTWAAPANYRGDNIQYQVIMTELESSPPKTKTITTRNMSYVFTGLQTYTAYGFQVAVVTANGELKSITEELTTKTLQSAPEAAPSDVTVQFQGRDRAFVSWTPPPRSSWNGPSIDYRIKYKDTSSTNRPTVIAVSFGQSSFVLTGLRRNKDYWLRMQAGNTEGYSPATKKIYFDTIEMSGLIETKRPGQPRTVEAEGLSREIHLTWSPPSDGVHVTQYVIGWGESGPYEHTDLVRGETEFYRITKLVPSTEYYIRLAAKNGVGKGQEALTTVRTLSVRAKPPEDLFPPLGVQVKALSHTSVNVSWHDADKGVAQRSYLIRYKTNVPDLPRVGYVNSTSITSVITGLRPHTVYEIAVKIIQGKRDSTWSMTTAVTTDESEPGSPPTDVTLMPIDNKPTFVQINWQPPVEPNGELTGYIIFYTTNPELGIDEWVVEPVDGGKLSTTIDGLTEDTEYYFKALALNREGESPFSDLVKYETPGAKQSLEVKSTPKPMAKWMWYLIIGSVALLVISIIIVAAIMICRNRKSRSPKRSKTSNSVLRHPSNIRSTSGESWPYSVKSAQSTTSVRPRPPQHHFEMRSIRPNDELYPPEFQKYQANAVPSEMEPLNGTPYGDTYPYVSHSHHHGEVMRSPVTSESCHCYPSNGGYGNNQPIQLSNLQRSTCEIAQYDVDYRYPYDSALPGQDYAVDSAYGSDHQHHHAVDEQPANRPLKFQSSRRHKSSYTDDCRPSERSSPLTDDSLHSTHGSETLSDDSMHIAIVKDYLRTARTGSESGHAVP